MKRRLLWTVLALPLDGCTMHVHFGAEPHYYGAAAKATAEAVQPTGSTVVIDERTDDEKAPGDTER